MKKIIFFKLFFVAVWVFTIYACSKGGSVIDDTGGGNGDDNLPQYSDSAVFEDIVQFRKNVLVMEFVSFDCGYCPNVSKLIASASAMYPGRIDLVGVHGHLSQNDPMVFDRYRTLQETFDKIDGYPASVIDQIEASVTVGDFNIYSRYFSERITAVPEVGIALNSATVNDSVVSVEVQVGNKGADADDYLLAVTVLENKIIYRQADVNHPSRWIENYEHNHVLRAFLSDNIFGDAIGKLKQNSVYSKTFTYTVPDGYEKDNLSFTAYVILFQNPSNIVAQNSRSAKIGESTGFAGEVK
jgi:thiol-disulfide isomerase/thioredoxin